MTPIIVILALLSFMIGNNLITLPVLSIISGLLASSMIIIVIGFLTFYSCYLYLEHLAIKHHLWNSEIAKVVYNFVTFAFLLYYLNACFITIVVFWDVIFPNQKSVLNPIFNAIGLFFLICVLKYFNLATKLLAFGTAFIFFYCFFLLWVLAQAPQGNNRPCVIGTNISLVTIFVQVAFQIQQIFIPILRYLPKQESNYVKRYTLITYIIAVIIYLFSGFVGSYGLINRQVIDPPAQSIYSYFKTQKWQVRLILTLNVLSTYFSFPQFMLITKKRFFAIINSISPIKNTNQHQFFTIPELIFVFLLMGIYLLLWLLGVDVLGIFTLPYVIVTFIYLYLVPAILQFKCLYFARPKVVFNIVFKDRPNQKDVTKLNETSADTLRSVLTQPLLGKQKSEYGTQQKYKNIIAFMEQKDQKCQISEIQSRKQSKVSAFQLSQLQLNKSTGLVPKQKQFYNSLDSKQQDIVIQTLNEVCPAELPTGWWKLFDLCSIFAMLALGMFVMIENFQITLVN